MDRKIGVVSLQSKRNNDTERRITEFTAKSVIILITPRTERMRRKKAYPLQKVLLF